MAIQRFNYYDNIRDVFIDFHNKRTHISVRSYVSEEERRTTGIHSGDLPFIFEDTLPETFDLPGLYALLKTTSHYMDPNYPDQIYDLLVNNEYPE